MLGRGVARDPLCRGTMNDGVGIVVLRLISFVMPPPAVPLTFSTPVLERTRLP